MRVTGPWQDAGNPEAIVVPRKPNAPRIARRSDELDPAPLDPKTPRRRSALCTGVVERNLQSAAGGWPPLASRDASSSHAARILWIFTNLFLW